MEKKDWYTLKDTTNVISPTLLVYPERVMINIETMIAIAGGTTGLRPHIKTHKTAEIINMQLKAGIHKFKCATIAEAELLGQCGAIDVLLSMQLVGVNSNRFFKLMEMYPDSKFSTLVDNESVLNTLANKAKIKNTTISLWLDINNGMNRTGILPDNAAVTLYKAMVENPQIEAKGLHVYDGHFRNSNTLERKKACDTAFKSVLNLKQQITTIGLSIPTIVVGGSPTFQFHAKRVGVETSPGTTVFWDAGYGSLFPELSFLPAAVLLTRIISKPTEHTLCLDLGHKSIAPEMSFPRVQFLNLPDSQQISQSEEHLVVSVKNGNRYQVGDVIYGLPLHICPTVAKYEQLQIVSNKTVTTTWKVAARNQKITL